MLSLRDISSFFAICLGVHVSFVSISTAYGEETCNSNVVSYWGQDSYGAFKSTGSGNWQKRLSYYCNDDSVDVFPIAFLNEFSASGGLPTINLANSCNYT